ILQDTPFQRVHQAGDSDLRRVVDSQMDVMIFAVICTSSDSKSAQNLANRARSRRASPVGDSPCHTWAWALWAWVGIDRCAPPPKVFPLRRGTSRNPLPSGTFREGRKSMMNHAAAASTIGSHVSGPLTTAL